MDSVSAVSDASFLAHLTHCTLKLYSWGHLKKYIPGRFKALYLSFQDAGNLNCTFFTSRERYNRKRNLNTIITAVTNKWPDVDVTATSRDDIVLNKNYKVSFWKNHLILHLSSGMVPVWCGVVWSYTSPIARSLLLQSRCISTSVILCSILYPHSLYKHIFHSHGQK